MKKKYKYFVVHSGARDYYALAKSLFDRGLLVSLITDFTLRLNLMKLKYARFNLPLPMRLVKHFPLHFFLAKFLNRDTDSFFSRKYLNEILKFSPNDTKVIVFSYYAKYIICELKEKGFKVIVFQIHPEYKYVKNQLHIATELMRNFNFINYKEVKDNEIETSTSEEELAYDFNCTDHIICASTETKKSLRLAGYSKDIHILPYYSKFENISDSLLEQKLENFKKLENLNILYIGTLSIRKGILHLLDALESKNAFRNIVLHICTRHNLNISILNNFIREGKVILHFNKTDEEVKALIINSQYVILPSFVEGFGLSLIESLSLCTPLIATKNTSLIDLNKYEKVGILCENIQGIVEYINSDNFFDIDGYNSLLQNCVKIQSSLNMENYNKSLGDILDSIEKKDT